MKAYFFFLCISFYFVSNSQTIEFVNGTNLDFTTCSAQITDGTGNYDNNVYSEITICSDIPGNGLQIHFTDLYLEDGYDFLYIYDGIDSLPIIITGNSYLLSTQPLLFFYTECVTIIFETDLSLTDYGFVANVTCFPIPTCNDGILNQGETTIDCGGCNCAPCSPSIPINPSDTASGILFEVSHILNSCSSLEAEIKASHYSNILIYQDNFSSLDTNIWDTTVTNFVLTNPCGPGPDSTYLWFNGWPPSSRIIQTNPLNLTQVDQLCFYYMTPQQSNPPGSCQGSDEYDEGISVQFSNTSCSWTDLIYLAPNGDILNSYPGSGVNTPTAPPEFGGNWNEYCINLPPSTNQENVSIRWVQWEYTFWSSDHWGLDEVRFIRTDTTDFSNYYYDWTHIPGAPDTNTILENITDTDTFTVYYTNGINDTVTANIIIDFDTSYFNINPLFSLQSPNCDYIESGSMEIYFPSSDTINYEITNPFGFLYSGTSKDTLILDSIISGSYLVHFDLLDSCNTQFDTVLVITDPSIKVPYIQVTNAYCPNGSIEGCNGELLINYSPPGYSSITTNNSSGSLVSYSHAVSNLCGGSYTIIMSHSDGTCIDTVDVIIEEPDSLYFTHQVNQPTCQGNNGSLSVEYFGGTPPYSFTSTSVPDTTIIPPNNNYSFIIDDANNCGAGTDQFFDIIPSPYFINFTFLITNEINGNDGAINITLDPGTYSFDWDNDGQGDFDDFEDLLNIPGGAYIIIIRDIVNQCETTDTIFVDSELKLIELDPSYVIIYPNPTVGVINVKLLEGFEYELLNNVGAIVSRGKLKKVDTIDLTLLSKGVYFLRLKKKDIIIETKIVRE